MIIEEKNNLLKLTIKEAQVKVHQVNCAGSMGAGLAKQVKKLYPEVWIAYKDICKKRIEQEQQELNTDTLKNKKEDEYTEFDNRKTKRVKLTQSTKNDQNINFTKTEAKTTKLNTKTNEKLNIQKFNDKKIEAVNYKKKDNIKKVKWAKSLLGIAQIIPTHDNGYICNLFAQGDYKRPKPNQPPQTNYEKFESGLIQLKKYMKEHNLSSVAFPRKIGCGLAGGDWSVIYKLLDKHFGDDSSFICRIVEFDG